MKLAKTMTSARSILFLSIFLFTEYSFGQGKNYTTESPLHFTLAIPLPNVAGRIDHLAFNSKQQLLYVAALGNNTVEVIDLKSRKLIHSIKGLHEPQGIRYISENNTIFVANGDNGECDVFNADTYQQISSIKLTGDADNVRYDAGAGRIYVGYGNGGIAIIDSKTFKLLEEIKLPGHPESFQLDNSSNKIFVNIPDAQILATIDLNKKSISDKWKVDIALANFPMSVDVANHRIFIGCRKPAKMLILNSENGKTIFTGDIDGDTDDLFYDNSSGLIYVSCGAGYIDIFKQNVAERYDEISKIKSRSGARTSLFVPELNELIVAAPARDGNEAQLMIYDKN